MENLFLSLGSAVFLISSLLLLKHKNPKEKERIESFKTENRLKLEDLKEELDFVLEKTNPSSEEMLLADYDEDEIDNKDEVKFESEYYQKKVVSLYSKGFSQSEIAKSLTIGKREVDIILRLNCKTNNYCE